MATTRVAISSINSAPAGAAAIHGTPIPGMSLTATHTIIDADGMGAVSLQWQSRASEGSSWISLSIGPTLSLTDALSGQQIRTVASYLDNRGTLESISSAIVVTVASFSASATGGSDLLRGTAASDALNSAGGNDVLFGMGGNDMLNGAVGLDTALYSGKRSDYIVLRSADSWSVVSVADGLDTLVDIERLIFADRHVAIDIDGVGGQAYRLYQAAFARTPDGGGLGFWMKSMDGGVTLRDVAAGFIQSDEYKAAYGTNQTNAQLVEKFYFNILGRAPERAGSDFWINVLNTKADTVEGVLAAISESAENKGNVAVVIGNGFEYIPYG